MSVAQVIRLHPHTQVFASLRTYLLRSLRMLVTQVVSRPLSLTEQGLPADVLDPAAHEQERLLDDVITQRVSVKRGHIERGLHPLLHTSYDICHCCQDKFAEAVCRSPLPIGS